MPLSELAPAWQERLSGLVDRLDVPGAALGVSHRGERVVLTAGIRGLRDPTPVTADTAFQLGSISKVYTATLLMMLAGAEIAERPVAAVVPEAAWMDPAITVGHLLTHRSGLGGDHFADTGRGDDALARYVSGLAELPRDVPLAPGSHYSYCNAGYGVLGRLIEVLAGETYDAALRSRLLGPLQATATSTLPEDSILGPVALGHNRIGSGPLTADARWNFARAGGPLGGVCATAEDVLRFAELHLRDGRRGDGEVLLAGGLAAHMRERHQTTTPFGRPSARGLGWGVYDWIGGELVGHDGETLGQTSGLRLLVGEQLAVVVLTNGLPDGGELVRELTETVVGEWGLTPVAVPTAGPVTDPDFDPTPYVGRYRNLAGTLEVSGEAGGLRVVEHDTAEGLDQSTTTGRLAPVGDGLFVDPEVARPRTAIGFGEPGPDGRYRAYCGSRVAWRVENDDE